MSLLPSQLSALGVEEPALLATVTGPSAHRTMPHRADDPRGPAGSWGPGPVRGHSESETRPAGPPCRGDSAPATRIKPNETTRSLSRTPSAVAGPGPRLPAGPGPLTNLNITCRDSCCCWAL